MTTVERALLERGEELRRIEGCLAAARGGAGSVLVIEGPAGIGKTALLGAARAAAREAGMTVAFARGAELEREFAYGAVRQLLEAPLAAAGGEARRELLAGAAALAAPLIDPAAGAGARAPLIDPAAGAGARAPLIDPAAGAGVRAPLLDPAAGAGARAPLLDPAAGAGGAGSAPPAPDTSFAVLHGLYWVCANLAARGPLLVAVDDAHWTDVASLRFLAYLARRLDELPVALVLAARPAEAGATGDLLTELGREPAATVVRPQPLSRVAVADLVAEALGREPDEPFAGACHEVTGGTPFLVRELARALGEAGPAPDAAHVEQVHALGPRTIARTILARLDRLGGAAVRLAGAAAVLGAEAELRHAAALADLQLDDATAAADSLALAGILVDGRPLRFVHPIVRTAIDAALPAGERARLHAQAARRFAAEGAPPERVAVHLLAAEPAGEPWVVDALREAAGEAVVRGAPHSAVAFLRRALAEPPLADARARLLLELGFAESYAGEPPAMEHLEAALEGAEDSAAQLSTTMALGRMLQLAGRHDRATEVYERTLRRIAGRDLAAELSLEGALVSAAQLQPATMPIATGADPTPARALRARSRGGADRLRAAGVRRRRGERARRRGRADGAPRVQRAPAHAAGGDRPAAVLLPRVRGADLVRGVRRGPGAARRGGRRRPAPGLAAPLRRTGCRARVAARARGRAGRGGGGRAAVAVLARCAALLPRVGAGVPDRGPRRAERAGRGRARDGRMRRGRQRGRRVAPGGARPAARRRGRAQDGLDDLLAAGELLTAAACGSPGVCAWRSEAALALLVLGRARQARALADEELALARDFGAPRALGVALRATGLVRDELELLRAAADTLAGSAAPLEHARALAELGAALRRAGRRREAREPLRAALDLAHRRGARAVAERARVELLATGARPRRELLTGVDSLTPSERRVATMAARGLTNREIAQALFVTARTVEGHLTHVFQKLGVESRAELPGAL